MSNDKNNKSEKDIMKKKNPRESFSSRANYSSVDITYYDQIVETESEQI